MNTPTYNKCVSVTEESLAHELICLVLDSFRCTTFSLRDTFIACREGRGEGKNYDGEGRYRGRRGEGVGGGSGG